jgi:WD40 repeat protein
MHSSSFGPQGAIVVTVSPLNPDRLAELLDRYLDQQLSEADRVELNQLLANFPEARHLFWEQVQNHALLLDHFAEARGRCLAHDDSTPPTRQFSAPTEPAFASSRITAWMGTLALCLLVTLGLPWLLRVDNSPLTPNDDPPSQVAIAQLGEVQGSVHIIANDSRAPARPGQRLLPGQEIHTGEGSSAVLTYPDSSRFELTADTTVRLLDPNFGDKRLFLVQGSVNATVAPQPVGRAMILQTPQAQLTAAGSRFSAAGMMEETRVEMQEGRATLSPLGDSRVTEMDSGTYAISAPDMEVYRSTALLPMSNEPLARFEDPSGPVVALAVLPGDQMAVGCWNGAIRLWDVPNRRDRGVLEIARKRVATMAVSLDGRLLAVGYEANKHRDHLDPSVVLWDLASRQVLHLLPGTRRPLAMQFLHEDKKSFETLAFVAEKPMRGVSVWDLPRGQTNARTPSKERFVLHQDERVQTLAITPDGRSVAVGLQDGRIRISDLNTGRLITTLLGHQREVQSLAFSPDGSLLASGSRDGSVRLWSIAEGEEIGELRDKFSEVRCLTFAPDGRTLASGHGGFAHLWDVANIAQKASGEGKPQASVGGKPPRATLKAHKFAITAMVYLDEGRILATAGWDRSVKLWELMPMDVLPE